MGFRLLPLLLSLALVACSGDAGDTGSPSGGIDSTQLAPGASGTATDTAAAVDTAGPVVTHIAVISTDSGDVEIELFGKDAPKTVRNFVELARKGYYEGLAFHRVIPGFVAQTGDPNSKDSTKRAIWGQGGESIYGDTFDDELDPTTPSARLGYREGIVAMANRGPNTNSSQFFIVLSDAGAAQLEFKYTVFGRVKESNEALSRIESTGQQGEVPRVPARIRKVSVREV